MKKRNKRKRKLVREKEKEKSSERGRDTNSHTQTRYPPPLLILVDALSCNFHYAPRFPPDCNASPPGVAQWGRGPTSASDRSQSLSLTYDLTPREALKMGTGPPCIKKRGVRERESEVGWGGEEETNSR